MIANQRHLPAWLRTAGLTTAIVLAAMCATAAAASARTLYVSTHGNDHHACTKAAPCKTISHAMKVAAKGDTVSVAKGTYREEVKISKEISVVGVHKPVLDAKGKRNGFLITGAGALVKGFVVEQATFEGILARRTSDVTITGNTVEDNDLGSSATHLVGECAPAGAVPGDCGEGLHLLSVTQSTVTSNVVENNDGGILLTDELGPTALNLIAHNRALGNVLDCGITLAGHSTKAVSSSGVPQPSAGGVYDNEVTGNTVDGNGTKGQGGGVLLAAPAPGGGVYDNVVTRNTADGNGLGGITLHSHAPGQDLNGNVITDNSVSNDGLTGDPSFGVTSTVGILVASADTALTGTEIGGNSVSNVHYGIWTENVPAIAPTANTFTNVTVPLTQS